MQTVVVAAEGGYQLFDLKGGESRPIHARLATAEERPRLWSRWGHYNGEHMEGWAARRQKDRGGGGGPGRGGIPARAHPISGSHRGAPPTSVGGSFLHRSYGASDEAASGPWVTATGI